MSTSKPIFSPDGKFLYLIVSSSNANFKTANVVCWKRDLETGALSFQSSESYLICETSSCTERKHKLVMSPAGNHIYTIKQTAIKQTEYTECSTRN